ncbi:MAG: sigma-70 family RNA polymerase sigma factor [Clostridiales bacterium]|nr:sigma-70 family RNA polymerase sigma factor [Clostridiales bacterium]
MNGKVQITGIDTNCLIKLSKARSIELMSKIKQGDKEAKNEFIMGNLRLVLSIIKRFNGAKVSADDMFQAGCIGLIKAVYNFDVSVGVCFSTYAVPMILGEIKRILRTTNSMRISRSIRDRAYQALKTRSELEKENEEVTIAQIAQKMQVEEAEVAYALDAISDTFSIYDSVYNKSGDTIELLDHLKDEKNTEESWTERVALQNALAKLTERERKIIQMRYYEGKTQTEISTEIGLSQAQVSRIEKLALSTMKKGLSYS